jgi:hypothetical protein
MGGRGPAPKPAATRQRQSKSAVRPAEFETATIGKLPNLPKREDGQPWHKLARAMWRDVQRSPMVAEYLLADLHRLYQLADLTDAYWRASGRGDVRLCILLAAELRNQGQSFGLTPLDRRRLQWEIKRVEKAEEPAPVPSRARSQGDARAVLHAL